MIQTTDSPMFADHRHLELDEDGGYSVVYNTKSLEEAISARMKEAFVGQPVTDVTKQLIINGIDSVLDQYYKQINQTIYGVSASNYCGACGKPSDLCLCDDLSWSSLDKEETPNLLSPTLPPIQAEIKPALSRRDLGMSKTTGNIDSKPTDGQICYLCADGRYPLTRVLGAGMLICMSCATEYLGDLTEP